MGNETKTLRDYAQHNGDCGGDFCSFPEPNSEGGTTPCCGGPDGSIHHNWKREYEHDYQRGICTCGLDALLSEPQPSLSAAVQTLEGLVESWRGRAYRDETRGRTVSAEAFKECADELAAALATLRQREDTTT